VVVRKNTIFPLSGLWTIRSEEEEEKEEKEEEEEKKKNKKALQSALH
jgi:hypothetical protein